MKNNNLIQARENKNLTQAELAEKLGRGSKSTVSNWENCYSTPPTSVAFQIADILEVDARFLFGKKVQDTHTTKREKVTS